MSTFDDPFAATRSLSRRGCSCGAHASEAEHAASAVIVDRDEDRYGRVVEGALMRAIFPQDATRRSFLSAVGASTALAALSQLLPIGAMTEAFAQGTGAIEKKALKVGFIPITCATPIIMAAPLGFYQKQGLEVDVVKTAGWAVIRDKTLNKEYDAAHMLAPMPLAIS
ncbi:ABC transporter substrate-binding protein, partial [uncultured Enterovirga sp.]|uniref:ABC transporter substrate-binding protein n=1 Tax=uncultured Enterovirga sp. TaxID=2026352 RepID=UPI0035CBDCD4